MNKVRNPFAKPEDAQQEPKVKTGVKAGGTRVSVEIIRPTAPIVEISGTPTPAY